MTSPAYEPEIKKLKQGTRKLLRSGTEIATDLNEHNLKPHFIAQVLQADRDRRISGKLAEALPTPNCKGMTLIEWRCEPDSRTAAI